jgi:hypothetical protein
VCESRIWTRLYVPTETIKEIVDHFGYKMTCDFLPMSI